MIAAIATMRRFRCLNKKGNAMLKTADRLRVSPTEQMYAINRIAGMKDRPRNVYGLSGMSGMGVIDPISTVTGIVTLFKKLGGLFTSDPNRDIHIPAQNAAVDGFRDILNQIETMRVQGTITRDALNRAVYGIQEINANFIALTNDLARKYPAYSSRYMAGQNEVVALGKRLIFDMTTKFAGQFSALPSLSDIADKVTGMFSGGGGMTPLFLVAGAFFFLPKLLKR